MKTNIDKFSSDSYYLAANAKAFVAKLTDDKDFVNFLADVILKKLPRGQELNIPLLDPPYTLYTDNFTEGLGALKNLTEEGPTISVVEALFTEKGGALRVHLVLNLYLAGAAFGYDYSGKLFGPAAEDFIFGDVSFNLVCDIKLPTSTPVDNLPAYEFFDAHIADTQVERLEERDYFEGFGN